MASYCLMLSLHLLGAPSPWFGDGPVAHARLRLIPALDDDNLPGLAWHIRAVSLLAVLFILGGVSIRTGGYPAFT